MATILVSIHFELLLSGKMCTFAHVTSVFNNFFAANSKYFTAQQCADLRNRMLQLPETASAPFLASDLKDPTTALLISLFAGGLGVDRFYIGDVGLGVGKLLTAGGCGIWAIIDLFLIMDATREKNYQSMLLALSQYA